MLFSIFILISFENAPVIDAISFCVIENNVDTPFPGACNIDVALLVQHIQIDIILKWRQFQNTLHKIDEILPRISFAHIFSDYIPLHIHEIDYYEVRTLGDDRYVWDALAFIKLKIANW